jgi:seryl-tRNA synthetase
MLDLNFIEKNLPLVQKGLEARGFSGQLPQDLVSLERVRRDKSLLVEGLRAKRNVAAKERNAAAGKKVKLQLDKEEGSLKLLSEELEAKLADLPNLPLPDVPVGDASKNKVIATSGTPRKFNFTPKDHLTIGERLDILDTQTAAKVSGTRFAYLKNEGALLELALVNFAFERLVDEGFTPVIPPNLIKSEVTAKLGYWQRAGSENYYLAVGPDGSKEEALYLIGTAEHAVVPMHWRDIIPKEDLPKRYVAYSPAYRREAGSYGKDTRGLIRVHQFEKVEMVVLTTPDTAEEEFNLILGLPWRWMEELGLPVRQVILASRDMSFPAAKTVDIETWFPSEGSFRETHSISTTTDFQARRLDTKFIDQGKTGFVHILNGTAFAIGRTLAAILENYQREDGSVEIPKALRRYTGFDEISC